MSTRRNYLLKDKPPGFLGSYSASVRGLGAASPTANLPYVAFRWAPSSGQICVIRAMDLRIQTTTAGSNDTIAGVFFARGFTASDTGGTAVSLTGDRQKKMTGYATSLVTDFRYTGGGGLTPGTRTLDPEPLFTSGSSNSATTTQQLDASPFGPGSDDPIILLANEGLVVANVVALTTTVYRYQFHVEWIEMAAGSL